VLADAILDVIFAGVEWLVGLLPTSSLDLSDLTELSEAIGWLGEFFDVGALAAVLAFVLGVEGTFAVIKGVLFVWRLTPLSG